MFPHRLFLGIAVLALCGPTLAQVTIYRCADDTGRNHYTNVKEEMSGKKCAVVSREISSVVPAPAEPAKAANGKAAPAAPRTAAAPGSKVADAAPAPGTGRAREDNRRRILQEELESEQKRLAEAKQKLAEQQPARPDETGSVLPRIKPYIEAVELAEKNVAQLRRELSNIK